MEHGAISQSFPAFCRNSPARFPTRNISRDASCGPDYSKPIDEIELRIFDNGFHFDDVDSNSTVAGSLRNVMRQALEAKAELLNQPEAAISRYINTLVKLRGLTQGQASEKARELGLRAKSND